MDPSIQDPRESELCPRRHCGRHHGHGVQGVVDNADEHHVGCGMDGAELCDRGDSLLQLGGAWRDGVGDREAVGEDGASRHGGRREHA